MANIQYIKNVTATAAFNASAGVFSKRLSSMPNQNPDEVVIRAINFRGDAADSNLYLIWCNLTGDSLVVFVVVVYLLTFHRLQSC